MRYTMMLLGVIIFCGCGERRDVVLEKCCEGRNHYVNLADSFRNESENWKAKYDSLLKKYYLVDVRSGMVYNRTNIDTLLFFYLEKSHP